MLHSAGTELIPEHTAGMAAGPEAQKRTYSVAMKAEHVHAACVECMCLESAAIASVL